MFQLQLNRCGVEFFDYYLLHCIDDENYEIAQRLDSFAFVQQKKAEGYIRQAGFSFHGTPELLEEVLTQHPEVDFVQLQINYLDWENPKVQSRRCYEVAVAHHKPVVVMEPVKGGKLANPSPAVREMFAALDPNASPSSFAIRFAASLEPPRHSPGGGGAGAGRPADSGRRHHPLHCLFLLHRRLPPAYPHSRPVCPV